ncbi:hypothetical protein C7974DRAFT_324110 [Boeremia exigua]|uniref:uncharacterized protein n=1 Tax=Boeremia exigua TaxID=749465 RepID=UPI001E8DED68|nr:uncharacterized protein C7974DRAFT_324110 [Boeremia exigua]KAH6611912.1 hypothetical protein C7974DRAFT_324110 [Boeremia exigua]
MDEDLQCVSVHGRVFQKISIDNGIYCVPVANDELEEDRLTAQHDVLFKLFGNHLFSPYIGTRYPQKILECGYGGGDWSVQVAEEFEDCEITAVDIYPMLVADQPENLGLCSYNLNDRLNDPEVFQARAYDLIHSRCISAGIKSNRWPSYIRDMKLLLRPSGWVQVVEYYLNIQSSSGRLTDHSAVRRWWMAYAEAMSRMNRDPRIGTRLQHLFSEARFADVRVETMQLPIGDWEPGEYFSVLTRVADPVRASIGKDTVGMMGDLLESLGLWPLTRHLNWTAAEFTRLINEVRTELQNNELKLYVPV